MKNERDNVRQLPIKAPADSGEFSFETAMKQQSREIVIKDFVPRVKAKPSDDQIDKASNYLNAFRMGIRSGAPTSLEHALGIEKRVNEILCEPTKLDTSKRTRRTKKGAPNKAA